MLPDFEALGKKHSSEDNDGIKEEILKAIEIVKKLKNKKENDTLTPVEEDILIYLTALVGSMNNPI